MSRPQKVDTVGHFLQKMPRATSHEFPAEHGAGPGFPILHRSLRPVPVPAPSDPPPCLICSLGADIDEFRLLLFILRHPGASKMPAGKSRVKRG
jgi:hypothetical protein